MTTTTQTELVDKLIQSELQHDKTNKMISVSSEDSDQPGHPPSLIIVIAVRIKKSYVLSYTLSVQQTGWIPRLIRFTAGRTCHFVGFVMLWLRVAVLLRCSSRLTISSYNSIKYHHRRIIVIIFVSSWC